MMLLLAFDLPRNSRDERQQANAYRKRLVELGFSMKQFSLYEREIRKTATRDRVISILKEEIPKTGSITLYVLPDEVNAKQVVILGEKVILQAKKDPRIIFL